MVVKGMYGGGTLSRVLKQNAKYLRNKKNVKKKEADPDIVFSQLYRYASSLDTLLMMIGTLAALANGIMLPLTSFLFGDLTSAFISQEKYADDPRYRNISDIGSGNNMFRAYIKETSTTVTKTNESLPFDFINEKVFLDLTDLFGMYYVYIGLVTCVLSFIQTACWESACCNQICKLRQIYFAQALRQDIAWYDERGNEDLTNKITDDMERMRDGLGSKVPVFFQAVSMLFSGLAVGFFTNWRLTIAIMIGGPVLVFTAAYTAKVGSGVAKREQLRYGIAGGIASEALTSIKTISAYGSEQVELQKFSEAVIKGKKLTMKKYYSLSVGMAVSLGFIYVLYGVGLWYGSTLFLQGDLLPGQLFTVFMSVVTGALGIGNSLPNIIEISTAIGSAALVLDIIDSIPKIDPYSKEGHTIAKAKGDIEFKNVYFSYPTRPQIMVLSGLDLTIPAGKVVAVVGSSGAGKSTLVSLILRFYDPICGKVCIDNNNITDLNVQNFRQLIGVVSQEPILFDVTIGENIRYGKPDATREEIEEAAKTAYAHTFIESLPQGYDTMVGERGVQISGGQKQRIAIARALVKNPKILLLDEATSALDSKSETIVQAALDNASKGRTTVIIAHRLSTIRNADLIYAMKDGRVSECGTHSELMEKKGTYYNLVLAQSKEVDESEEQDKAEIQAEIIMTTTLENGDPKQEKRSWNSISMSRLFSKSTESINNIGKDMKYFNLLRMTDSTWMIVITAISCLIAGCQLPCFSVLYGGILGLFVLPEQEFRSEVLVSCAMFGALAFITALTMFIAVLASSSVTEDMIKEMRIKTFKNILSQQISYFDKDENSPIKLTNTLAKEPPLVKNIAGMRAGYIIITVVTTLLSLAIAFYCGWRIALIVLCFVPFIVLGNWVQMRMRFQSYLKECETTEKVAKIASECFQNIKTVQFLCLQEHMLDVFTEELQHSHKDEKKQSYIFSITFAIVQATIYIMYGCTFRFGSEFVDKGYMTGEDIYRTVFALVFASTNLGTTALFFQDFGKAKVAITRVVKLMTTPSTLPLTDEGEKPEIKGNIQFKDIAFSYPTRRHIPVLMGFNLEVPEGKTVALVGGSGCGKSTLVGLLERFYSPKKGQIYLTNELRQLRAKKQGIYNGKLFTTNILEQFIDGININKINIPYLRSKIGLVTQEPTLFDSSLRENITYGVSSLGKIVTEQDIIEAAKAANIHEFITSLPQGYETSVGERGSKLSGGQKQRVAIARALLRNPKILLLDEATSALDTESEKVVQDALDNARQGRTSIVIAHRLSTIQSADLIAVVSEGRVVELGSHSQLLDIRGLYYDMVKSQCHS